MLFASISFAAQSQYRYMKFLKAQKFLKTKLVIAIDEEEPTLFYESFMKFMEKHWEFNEYEFISPIEAEKYLLDENYSVLSRITHLSGARKNSDLIIGPNYNLVLGNKNFNSIQDESVIASFGLTSFYDFKLNSWKYLNYSFMTYFYVKVLINGITDVLNEAPFKKVRRDGKAYYYNKGKDFEVLQSKENIYIYEGCLNENFKMEVFCDIFKLKPDKIKFLNEEEFTEMLESEDPDAAFVVDYKVCGAIYDGKTFRILAEKLLCY